MSNVASYSLVPSPFSCSVDERRFVNGGMYPCRPWAASSRLSPAERLQEICHSPSKVAGTTAARPSQQGEPMHDAPAFGGVGTSSGFPSHQVCECVVSFAFGVVTPAFLLPYCGIGRQFLPFFQARSFAAPTPSRLLLCSFPFLSTRRTYGALAAGRHVGFISVGVKSAPRSDEGFPGVSLWGCSGCAAVAHCWPRGTPWRQCTHQRECSCDSRPAPPNLSRGSFDTRTDHKHLLGSYGPREEPQTYPLKTRTAQARVKCFWSPHRQEDTQEYIGRSVR